jgi:hypothetical protein
MKLFKTLEIVQDFVNVGQGMDLKILNPHERTALARYIYPALGQAMYAELGAAYTASPGTPMPSALAELLPYVQSALAKFTLYCWSPEGAVNISASGISVSKSDTLLPASEVKVANLNKSYLQGAFSDLELMLEFLEDHRGIMAYSSWKSSSNYTIFKQFFIPTANEFSDYVKISGRFTFLQLRGSMRSVQEFDIKKTLQATIYNSIVSALQAGTSLDSEQTELMTYIKPAFAFLSMAKALDTLAVVQDERGISLFNTNNTQVVEAWQALDKESRDELKNQYQAEGQKYLRELLNVLEAGDYTGYTKAETGALDQYENKVENHNYFL